MQYKRQKDIKLKDKLPRPVGAQYITGKEWRNSSRTNEEMEPKQKNKNKIKNEKQTNKKQPIVV